MSEKKCSDEEFIAIFRDCGATEMAKRTGLPLRGVFNRRKRLEEALGIRIVAPPPLDNPGATAMRTRVADLAIEYPHRTFLTIENGTVLIGSDCHYWPKIVSTAHRAFVKFAKKLQPKAIILNGDVCDFAGISRFPSIGWENKPTVIDEIEGTQERLTEIQKAAPNAERIWTLGNHDARLESRLANVAPEYRHIHGVHLKDHFPYWQPCWACWINPDVFGGPVVKHRFKSGIHAPHNNAMWSGRTIVTGHLHSQKVYPLTDYNGTRWGVDGGTLAEPYGPQFVDYTEDAPVNWRSGFVVLTFVNGVLLQPQLARVMDKGKIDYCGQIIEV